MNKNTDTAAVRYIKNMIHPSNVDAGFQEQQAAQHRDNSQPEHRRQPNRHVHTKVPFASAARRLIYGKQRSQRRRARDGTAVSSRPATAINAPELFSFGQIRRLLA
jgi:hypothetical protein